MSIPSKLLTAGASTPEPSGEVLFTATNVAPANSKTSFLMTELYPASYNDFDGKQTSNNPADRHIIVNWTVPEGVRTIQACMVGTGSFAFQNGGKGGSLVHGTIPVSPGQVLEIHIPKQVYLQSYSNSEQSRVIDPKIYHNGVLLLDVDGYGVFTNLQNVGAGGLGGYFSNYSNGTGGGGGGAGGYRGFSGGLGGSRSSNGGINDPEVPADGGGGGGGRYTRPGSGVGVWGEGLTVVDSQDYPGSEGYKTTYGAGGAGAHYYNNINWPADFSDMPGVGAIRLIWGEGREYPDTNTDESYSWTKSLNGQTPTPQGVLYTVEGTHTYEVQKDGFISGVCLGGGGSGFWTSLTHNNITYKISVRAASGGANANFDNLPVKKGDVVTITVPPRALGPVDYQDTSFAWIAPEYTAWTSADHACSNDGGDTSIAINGYECKAEGGKGALARYRYELDPYVSAKPIHTNPPAGLTTNGGEGGEGGLGVIDDYVASQLYSVGGGGGAGGYDGRGGKGADGSVDGATDVKAEDGVGTLSGAGGGCNTQRSTSRQSADGGPGATSFGGAYQNWDITDSGASTAGGACPIFGMDFTYKPEWSNEDGFRDDNFTVHPTTQYYTVTAGRYGAGAGTCFTWGNPNSHEVRDHIHGGEPAAVLYFSETSMPAQPFHLTE